MTQYRAYGAVIDGHQSAHAVTCHSIGGFRVSDSSRSDRSMGSKSLHVIDLGRNRDPPAGIGKDNG